MARGAKQPGIDAGKHKEAGLHCLAAPALWRLKTFSITACAWGGLI